MNLVVGDRIEWNEKQFTGGSNWGGRFRGAKFVGTVARAGVIERESYGATGQHTFSVRLDDGTLKRVKGRNLYPNITRHEPGADHIKNADEKTARSDAAKIRREERAMGA